MEAPQIIGSLKDIINLNPNINLLPRKAEFTVQPLISLLAQESRKLIEGHPVELHHELNRHTEQQKHIRHKNLKLSISEYI